MNLSEKPVLWYRSLSEAEVKPDGPCYDVVFCDPHDSRYQPLYSDSVATKVPANVEHDWRAMADAARAKGWVFIRRAGGRYDMQPLSAAHVQSTSPVSDQASCRCVNS